jgi:hypothetical protein
MSIANIMISEHTAKPGFNKPVKVYKNVKAIQAGSKSYSKFFGIDSGESSTLKERSYYSGHIKINIAVFSKNIYCFVKSYLHLLQLF